MFVTSNNMSHLSCWPQPESPRVVSLQGLITVPPQQPQPNPNTRVNQIIEVGLTTAVNAGAVVALTTSASPKDILSLAAAQIITTTAKNLLKKAKVPKVVSYPALIGGGLIAFFSGVPILSDICFTVAAKNFNKDMKDVIKGKPIRLILTEGVDENRKRLERAKNCLPCVRTPQVYDQESLIVSPQEVDDGGDSESDDIEWTPPPKWVQIAMIGGVGVVGGVCYAFLPLPNTGIELLSTTSKMATVALRQLPLVPADSAAVAVGGTGAAINYAVAGDIFSGSLAGPALSFPLDVTTDNVKMYMKGKWKGRPFLPEHPCQNSNPMQLAVLEDKKGKKKKVEVPSTTIQTGILVADAALAIGTNFAQPQGGMLPHKATSLFTSLFDMACIRGHSNAQELGYRFAGYGAALAGACLFDITVNAPVKLTKIVGSTVMKLAAAKEIKNFSNLDFVGGFTSLKEKVTGCTGRNTP